MTTCRQVMNIMEQIAPRRLAEEWDNPGLLVGSPEQKIDKILVALDADERVVNLAIAEQAQMIVAHHPLIFKPLKKIRTDTPQGGLLQKILRHDLAVFAAHTNLDAATGGVNDILARKLNLTEVKPLLTDDGDNPGLGRVGQLVSPVSVADFAAQIKSALDIENLRLVPSGDKLIRKVALCGGSAAEFIDRAAFLRADAYVTGDVRYHDAQRAVALGLHVIDAGHFGTEFPVVAPLADRMREGFAVADIEAEIIADTFAKDCFVFV